MPCIAFRDPLTDEIVLFKDAPAHFEASGVCPAEVIVAMIADVEGERSTYDPRYLSPSKLYPGNLCRRQMVLERFLDYELDPWSLWEALEGTVWHSEFSRMTAGDEWIHDVSLPGDVIEDRLTDAPVRTCEDGWERVEVCPGLWLRGTGDRFSLDYTIYVDHKTTKFPFAQPPNYVPKRDFSGDQIEEYSYQFSAYAHIVEIVTGNKVQEAWAWRTYRGSRNRAYTFKKLRVPIMDRDTLWRRLEPWIAPLLSWLAKAHEIREWHKNAGTDPTEGLKALVKSIPMDGRDLQMFNGQKCTKYCTVQKICFGLEGELEF